MGILDRVSDPAEAQWGGRSTNRRAITPGPGRGLVAIVGPDGLFYANTVGAFGAASAGRNWDRLASAVHMWGLKLVENNSLFMLLFPDGELFLAGSGIFEESFLSVTSPLMIPWYLLARKNYGRK